MTDPEVAFERYVSDMDRGILNLDATQEASPVLVQAEDAKRDYISLVRLQESLDRVQQTRMNVGEVLDWAKEELLRLDGMETQLAQSLALREQSRALADLLAARSRGQKP